MITDVDGSGRELKRRSTTFLAFTIAFVGMVVTTMPAGAISGGELDGEAHPNVGALLGRPPGEEDLSLACSGFLISPTVFLTAGHCTRFFEEVGDPAFVTFDSVFDPESSQVVAVSGFTTHPDFNPNSLANDLGVVLLAKSVRGVTPVRLPTAGLLDAMKASGTLPSTLTVASYGIVVDCSSPPCTFTEDGARRFATESFTSLQRRSFTVGNGLCGHDSGSPHLLPGTNTSIGVTSAVTCNTLGQAVRLDTASARSFLGRFVTLP